MNAGKLAQYSELARKKMQETTDQPARLDVIGVTPGAFFKVLNVLDLHTGELQINVHNSVLPQAIALIKPLAHLPFSLSRGTSSDTSGGASRAISSYPRTFPLSLSWI